MRSHRLYIARLWEVLSHSSSGEIFVFVVIIFWQIAIKCFEGVLFFPLICIKVTLSQWNFLV